MLLYTYNEYNEYQVTNLRFFTVSDESSQDHICYLEEPDKDANTSYVSVLSIWQIDLYR